MAPASTSDAEELGTLLQLFVNKGRLSIKSATLLFGCHYLTLLKWVEQGWVRTITVGSRKYITVDEYKRWKEHGNWDPSKDEAVNGGGEERSSPQATLGDYYE